ncbi:inactive peptidyl-prolyl cis-trans isomerase FKBP6-like [Rhipicephalus microplus]|uniref:inactive peptidyl-prolyl cis-trans isomerase FKBP6-like n=1 Tax=Rhipicephalus microplus TaxID=6941 RepID=UPI003F6BC075
MECLLTRERRPRVFHMESTDMQNLTDDGGVQKKIIVHGSGHRVTPHAKVHFHCTTIAQSEYTERIDCSVMRNSPFRCYVKQAGVPGLQIALKSMRVGEQCQVRVSPEYGYGDVGCGHRIPPGAVLYFEVTLLNCVQTHSDCVMSSTEECSRLPFSELYKICCVKYRNANKFLAAKNFVDAERGYSAAEKQLKSAPEPAPDEQRYQRRELLLKLYHKLAYCRLEVHNPKMAVESCRHILRLDPSDPRALYRCAVGLRQLGEYEEAARMQQHAFALKPHSKHIINELVLLEDYVSMKPVRDKHVRRCSRESPEELDMSSMQRRLLIEQAVDPYTRNEIDKGLNLFKSAETPGRDMYFDGRFSKNDLAYIRMKCDDLELPYHHTPDGLCVRRASA